jgi:NAD(P)-dependent dehydrogenase (short-subunit alcohol dehydrogenase family)
MLKEKVAQITDAASIKGIGFGIVKKLAENGCNIYIK